MRGHVAVAELLIAAGAQINHRNNVRAPPPPRARRALSRSRPPPPPRARERERPRRSRAARVSGRAILSASARRRGASPRERTSPPRASRPLSLLTMSRARASRVQGGETPLFVAACYGQLDVVRALLNAGADKTIANNRGYKPIDVVCGNTSNKQHKAAIVALLR